MSKLLLIVLFFAVGSRFYGLEIALRLLKECSLENIGLDSIYLLRK